MTYDLSQGDSTLVLTGAADNSARLWDCEMGKELTTFHTQSAVRTCSFSHSGQYLMYSTDEAMSNKCEIFLYDVRDYESPVRWALFIVVQCNLDYLDLVYPD